MRIPVGIVGFRGYSGAELEKILDRHPGVAAHRMEHRADTERPVQPAGWRQAPKIACTAEAAQAAGIRLVFLATPVDVSIQLTVEFLANNIRVIDLSGAFRLRNIDTFTRWYKESHNAPQLMVEAIYGLPEFNRREIAGARLLSNPGCYPTAANLATRA
jgi:N-acetyl-gamma-glutamyl-phosphate reductase